MKKVAIIVTNYNGLSALYGGKSILWHIFSSMRKNTRYGNCVTILADDCSTDASVSYVKKEFPWVEIVVGKKNGGVSTSLNNGFRYAMKKHNPDYMLMMNNDMIVNEGDWISKLVSEAESHDNVGLEGCKLVYPDGTIQHAGMVPGVMAYNIGRARKDGKEYSKVEYMEALSLACGLISRDVIKKVGLFDENFFMGCEDLDYCLRAKEEGFKILYNGQVKIVHLEGFTSTHASSMEVRKEMFYRQQKNVVYLAFKHYGLLAKLKALVVLLLGSVVSIEGKGRPRGLSGLRLKNMPGFRLSATLRAIGSGYGLYMSSRGAKSML